MKKYPFEEFVNSRMTELNLSRKDLVLKIGFKNLGKGYRRVDSFIAGGYPFSFENEFAQALGVTLEEMNDVYKEDKAARTVDRKAYERVRFKPYICAMMERRIPSPIFVGCMTDGMRYIRLDNEFLILREEEQMLQIKDLITLHFAKNEGGIPAFGKILHYVYRKDYDQDQADFQIFDSKGDLIIAPSEDIEIIQGVPGGLTVKGRRLI